MSRMTVRQCGWCGKDYTARWVHFKNRWTIYCSTSCSSSAYWQGWRDAKKEDR